MENSTEMKKSTEKPTAGQIYRAATDASYGQSGIVVINLVRQNKMNIRDAKQIIAHVAHLILMVDFDGEVALDCYQQVCEYVVENLLEEKELANA